MAESVALVPGAPVSMAMEGDDLIIATGGEIASTGRLYRITKTGETTQQIYSQLGFIPTIAVNGDRIVIGDTSAGCEASTINGALLSVSPEDDVTVLSRDRGCPRLLRADSTRLYFVEDNAVRSLPTDATPQTTPTTLVEGSSFITRLELFEDDRLGWVELANPLSTLRTISRTGGPATVETTLTGAFASRDGQLAFERMPDLVVRDLTGAEASLPVINGGGVSAIALDGPVIYWNASGAVVAGDVAAGSQRVLARTDGIALLQDELFIYTAARDGNATRVSRIRKPAVVRRAEPIFECASPLQRCGFDSDLPCVDVTSDRDHCGGCDQRCGAGELCEAGQCECTPAFVCGGSCVDLMVDPQHCGSCDHACDGECKAGACAPVAVTADGVSSTNIFVQDADAIYFANGGVKRLDKQTHAVSLVRAMEPPGGIAVDATSLYVIDRAVSTDILSIGKTGTGSSVLYSNRPDARGLDIMGNTLVWTEDEAFGDDTRTLVRAAKDGSGILSSITAVGVLARADIRFSIGFAVDGEIVYWLFDTNDGGGALVRVDFSTASPSAALVTLFDLQPTSLAVRGDDVFVTLQDSESTEHGELVSVPKTGGAPTFVANVIRAEGLEVTDGRVRWIDHGGSILRELDPVLGIPYVVTNTFQHATKLLSVADGTYAATSSGILFVQR